MLRSRLSIARQPLIQRRTLVTQANVAVNNENKIEQKDKTNEYNQQLVHLTHHDDH